MTEAARNGWAVAAINGKLTLIKFSRDFDVHPNQIKKWHNQFLKGATGIFGYMPKTELIPRVNIKKLYVKIEELALGKNLLSGAILKVDLFES